MKKKHTLWVISSSVPTSHGVQNNCFCNDQSSSDIRSKWKRFYTWDEAKTWANKNNIEINDTTNCIIQVEFTDFEMSR